MSILLPNNPESSQNDAIALPFSQDLTNHAESLATGINTCDDALAATLIEQLNQHAGEEEVIGEHVSVNSGIIIQTRFILNPETLTFDVAPCVDNSTESSVEGKFVGFEEYSYNGKKLLMYRLETIVDNETLMYDVVNVPVLGTGIVMTKKHENDIENDHRMMVGAITELATIKDPNFAKGAKKFLEIIQAIDALDAPTIVLVGEQATYLVNHEAINDNLDVKKAILSIVSLVMNYEDIHKIVGHRIEKHLTDDENKVVLEVLVCEQTSRIAKTVLVPDYTIDKKAGLSFHEERLQPAFFLEVEDDEYIYPLRYLQEYYEAVPIDMSCNESLRRFRDTFSSPSSEE